jgi:hypothetical protein
MLKQRYFIPLYLIVSKFSPTRFGSKKSFLPLSQVPSPTFRVFEEYVLLPGAASCGEGDIVVTQADSAQ